MLCAQVVGVLDAMPSSNLKPEEEDGVLEADRVYRTTIMFSATMPPTVERLARKYMRRPAVINIGSAGKATDNVTQKVMPPTWHLNTSVGLHVEQCCQCFCPLSSLSQSEYLCRDLWNEIPKREKSGACFFTIDKHPTSLCCKEGAAVHVGVPNHRSDCRCTW